jgi:putative phosphoesterase
MRQVEEVPAMPVRIGVIADTHLSDRPEDRRFLAGLAARHFHDAALILHAGDIVVPELLTAFLPTPVYAVRGNMDPATGDTPPKRVVTVGGLRIGLIHGWGAPAGIVERILPEFSGTPLDCLVFGHTHTPCLERRGGLLLFNPGSATDRRGQPHCSIGLLEVEDGAVRGRIIMLDNERNL